MNISDDTKDSLLATTERCLAMQADHLSGLASGDLSQAQRWLEERQTIVAKLRQDFAKLQASGIDPELRSLLLDRLQLLMEGEARLFVVISAERGRLCESLSTLRRGRRALAGYGPGRKRSPRFFNGLR